jgi:PAS domain S-box-containing protein
MSILSAHYLRFYILTIMSQNINIQTETEKKLAHLVAEKEQRFEAYMENAYEAIWRIDFQPPLSMQASESQQVRNIFKNTIIGEANDAMAKMYGYNKGREVIGRPLKEFMLPSNRKNVDAVTTFIRNGWRINDMVTHEKLADGSIGVFLNNVVPTIKNGMLQNTWGSSIDITNLYRMQERLEWSMVELDKQKKTLIDKNIALKELIAQIELEKEDMKDRITANLEQVILPSLEKISLNLGAKPYIEQHRRALLDMTSSFGRKISDSQMKMTPREIEVCNLVRNGLTNKEIARLLNIALHTVEKHRRMARNKLGIANKGINLRTYLSSV